VPGKSYDPRLHHRHSIRLRGYDYSLAGMYFVTFCVSERAFLFGEIDEGNMLLNDAGKAVLSCFDAVGSRYRCAGIDCLVIMPNHVHAVIVLSAGPIGCGILCTDLPREPSAGLKLSDVVHDIKLWTANAYRSSVRENGWRPYVGTLWQRDCFEHIVRDAESLARIRAYIRDNPSRWAVDRENPAREGDDPFDLWLDSLGQPEQAADQQQA